METIELCETGDVILVPGYPATKRFQVSSVVLANASPVFGAMFSGRYTEGQGLSSAAPKVITLEEDEECSLEIMLRLIHLRPKDVDNLMTTGQGPAVATLCDKYDTLPVLRQTIGLWLTQAAQLDAGGCDNANDLCNLCATAFISGNTKSFEVLTNKVATTETASFCNFIKSGKHALPPRIFAALDELREECRSTLRSNMNEFIGGVNRYNCTCSYDYDSREIARLFLAIETCSVVDAVEKMLSFIERNQDPPFSPCAISHGARTASSTGREGLKSLRSSTTNYIKAMMRNVKGLSLAEMRA
ncbi:hypothetical protein KVT40_003828 [Elsinoe batatas]|uniref:BTB domain-containing protein n=1 Tax=Elsinoe batatas TaxID=2601811 RepID=A0A8K0L5Q4_9PEZI|nr:hypothetical protein KVT40_003828 [Elsinoe batatas]